MAQNESQDRGFMGAVEDVGCTSVARPSRQTKKTATTRKNDFEIRTRYGTIIANDWRGIVMLGLVMAALFLVAMLRH
jgi:hypothetical protein